MKGILGETSPAGAPAVTLAEQPPALAPQFFADKMPTAKQLRHLEHGEPVAIWPYHNEQRQLVEVRARYDLGIGRDGKQTKKVVPWIWNGAQWVNKQAPGKRPLYNLTALLADPDADVIFTEGEKKSDAAERIFPGYVATNSSGGCQSHAGTDYSHLKGHNVIIWPDNDEPGRKYAEDVIAHAYKVGAASIAIVDVPKNWPKGWDLADEPPSDSIYLLEMLQDARKWSPPAKQAPTSKLKPDGKPFRFASSRPNELKLILDGQWLIEDLVSAKGLMVAFGPSGCGKSFLVLDAALHIAEGRQWAGRNVEATPVFYIAAEGQGGFDNRVIMAMKRMEASSEDIQFALIKVAPNLGVENGDAAELIGEIRLESAEYGWSPGLIVIDTLAQVMYGGNESTSEGMGTFIANANLIARELDGLVIAVHHTGKDVERGMRGWSGLHAACDTAWEVSQNENGERSVRIAKQKEGETGLAWKFQLDKVEVGTNKYGNPVTTCVVELTSEPGLDAGGGNQKPKSKASRSQLAFDAAFDDAVHEGYESHAVGGDARTIVKAVNVPRVREHFAKRWATGETDKDKRRKAISAAFLANLRKLSLRYATETAGGVELIWRTS